MRRFDVGITEGEPWPLGGSRCKSRRVDLVGLVAIDEEHAIDQARSEWRARYREEVPTALIGISRAY